MKVIRASVLGFCMGVRRAVETASKTLQENPDLKVYSFGPLIHNPVILQKLETQGLSVIGAENLESIQKNSLVIVRAHGIRPDLKRLLDRKEVKVIDATCPKVLANQNIVKKYCSSGRTIILTGDKGHGEVEGIAGVAQDCKGEFYVAGNLEQARLLKERLKGKDCVLLSQTTFSHKDFELIAAELKSYCKSLEVMKTICSATCERQTALEELSQKTQAVIVIGGKKSANTVRLYEKAVKLFKYAVHIESALEIPDNFFSFETVGITAGASTPDFVVDEVEDRLNGILK